MLFFVIMVVYAAEASNFFRSPVKRNERSLWKDLTTSDEYADLRNRVMEEMQNDRLQAKMAKKRGGNTNFKRSLVGELLTSKKYANFRKRAGLGHISELQED